MSRQAGADGNTDLVLTLSVKSFIADRRLAGWSELLRESKERRSKTRYMGTRATPLGRKQRPISTTGQDVGKCIKAR